MLKVEVSRESVSLLNELQASKLLAQDAGKDFKGTISQSPNTVPS